MQRPTNLINGIDWITVGLYLVLVLTGWLNIYASVFDEQNANILSISQRYGKQLLWIITAISLAVMVCLIDARFYSSFAYPVYIIGLLMLIAVLIVGKEVNNSKSWFEIGSLQIQPSEFVKITTGLALAKYMGNYSGKLMQFRNVIIISATVCLPVILILLQHDLGSALVYLAFLIVLYREGLHSAILLFGMLAVVLFILSLLMQDVQGYLAGGLILLGFVVYLFKSRQIKLGLKGIGFFCMVFGVFFLVNLLTGARFDIHELLVGAFIPVFVFFAAFAAFRRLPHIRIIGLFIICALVFTFSVDFVFDKALDPHHQKRILVMLGKESDPKGIEYNVIQSKIAIGSGGFSGKGFLQGTQTKLHFVPEQSTDFIFCTVGEEWGFAGVFVIVTLFIVLLLRLIFLAERQRSVFSRVYGYSVVSILFMHFGVNIAMTVELMPVIGIPLPFFSYGGSSLWTFTILLFILLRLDASRYEYIR
ncbi:MAG: rod shape-determining protein RodA [Bacteroidales bacterium]|jgi:rod shape determining protein RodA|nr:rod shape-determining protein RodA [Bacteroidales bacterium]